MKLFRWMQSKLSAKHGDKKAYNTLPPIDQKNQEEFNDDWPSGLLSIGTMGYKDDVQDHETSELVERSSNTNIPQVEECLQKELTELLRHKSTSKVGEITVDMPFDKFLNCPSSLEVDQDIDRTIRIILGRCKDACEKKRAMLGKNSLSFHVKKVFLCRGGFASTPSLRDAFQQSRMEKLMRAMLANKIHPRDSCGTLSTNKSIEDYNHVQNVENIEERFKWDKTDSEFIVLEI